MTNLPKGCPWPPPRPVPRDHPKFLGRSIEIDTLAEQVSREPLTILSAASGAGKTSIIQSGLVPELRRRSAAGRLFVGPSLLLRDWASVGNPASRILVPIVRAVDALVDEAQSRADQALLDDALALLAVEPPRQDPARGVAVEPLG